MRSDQLRVSSVRFRPALPVDVAAGLLGYVRATIDGLVLDGIAVRRTLSGRLDLRYPERRRARQSRSHPVVRPADEGSRVSIEAQIFDALRAQGVLR